MWVWGWEGVDQLWEVSPEFPTPQSLLFITGIYSCATLESHVLIHIAQRFPLFYKHGFSIDGNLSCRVDVGVEILRNSGLNY